MKSLFIIAAVFGSIGFAEPSEADCPENIAIEADLDRAYDRLKFSKFASDADLVTGQLWALWTQAPDQKSQMLLSSGLLNIKRGNLKLAEKVLSELITYCPNYAEGYNQRAFARYLDSNFEKALFDLQDALNLRPRHLGALSGKALTHVALGQEVEAQIELRKALALNPFMPEREMIKDLGTDL